jgi:transposase InsO family protein
MQVSRNGFYAWRVRLPSRRAGQDAVLVGHIRAAHRESHQTYGSPRLYHELREQGLRCGRHRIARLMRENGLSARLPKRFVATTDSRHALPVAQNLLGRGFSAERANTKWCGDITYVPTAQGWLYLAVVLDLFSRRVIGWAMRETLERELAVAALSGALAARDPSPGLLCHNDRGAQYASGDYQNALAGAGATCSMSRRGDCRDNAPIESFFASLKRELVERCRFATREEARGAIFEWIEAWYNRKRRHSALGYLSPEEFERRHRKHYAMAA